MFNTDNIEGIESLRKQLPTDMHGWSFFSKISELHYKRVYDNEYCDYIGCMELILGHYKYDYTIKMQLYNIIGTVSFDVLNGFCGALAIEDRTGWGLEKQCTFRIYSFEQGIDLEFYCERIKVEPVEQPEAAADQAAHN